MAEVMNTEGTATSVGRSVTAAMRFLDAFHRDVRLLIQSLDRLFSECHWERRRKDSNG